jgi:hypothetical protein
MTCWGTAASGQLGHANTDPIGDDEPPSAAGPVDLGAARSAVAISAGGDRTCARLDGGVSVRCWGKGANGALGYCNLDSIGDDETPGSAGPVDLGSGAASGVSCPLSIPPPLQPPTPAPQSTVGPAPESVAPAPPAPQGAASSRDAAALGAELTRAADFRGCREAVTHRTQRERATVTTRYARRPAHERSLYLRAVKARASTGRRRCLERFGRTPGRVTTLAARPGATGTLVLTFNAPGSNGSRPPAARGYLIKQSLRPIRTPVAFKRSRALCKGVCNFSVTQPNTSLELTVDHLRRHTHYYYAIAARDNVTHRTGPRSKAIIAKTG